jgi:purine-cytosine permease-like protein
MKFEKKKTIFLIILAVVLISTVTFIGYLVSKSDVLTPTVEVFGEGDGSPTTIHISLSIPPWLILINALLLISIDLIIITIFDTIKHIKKIEIFKLRYKIISVVIINFLISFLIPIMIYVSIIITILIVIFLFIKKKFRKENDKNKEGQAA